ncbi:ADP-ribose pyrophosphatase [Rhodovastum atsumiense]|nr:NUDIX domain-containing protein [Rhodovastum atsumiense]CAH2604998.1 ADP-ribose pyrophosphatase [Rhodovastum atsumiense]
MPKSSPLPPWPGLTVESDETVWNGRFPLQRIKFRHRRFDGDTSPVRTWELWRRGRAAALLPYDPVADVVVLIEQFRLPALAAGVDPVMVEVPAGLCDPGEDVATTLVRETQEELGLTPRRILPISDILLSPGGCDEFCALHAGEVTAPPCDAEGIVGRTGLASEAEDIQVRIWPADRAIEAALAGQMPNAVTAIALLWLAAKRETLRTLWKDPA